MFEAAPEEDRELQPYCVFTGDSRIERHVPADLLRIDHHRLQELVRITGIYRLALGQPRQDEPLAALGTMDGGRDDLVIDLAHRGGARGFTHCTSDGGCRMRHLVTLDLTAVG
jgi:hypothetical protein